MSALPDDGRHLSREGLQLYLAEGAPAAIKIAGAPVAYLVVEPGAQKLSLRVPLAKNTLPDLVGYQNLTATVVHWEGGQWCQISITGPVVLDAYPLLIAIADRVQLQALEFARATKASLDAFRELLAGGAALTEEQKIGLFGELLVLERILNAATPETAVSCWRGADAEEHDFDVDEGDVEVKTTTSETRRHWIGSLGQLSPSLGRPLWLVSIQLTAAGMGGASLGELIARIEAKLDANALHAFRSKLATLGWRDEYAEDVRRMRYRSSPAVYRVDSAFPALTHRELNTLGLGADKIVQLNYMLDLSNVPISESAPKLVGDVAGGAPL